MKIQCNLIYIIIVLPWASTVLGFGNGNITPSSSSSEPSTAMTSRRKAFTTIIGSIGVGTTLAIPTMASARDELFKPNPLTNPILEKIRIMDQDYADNIRYGGELAPGGQRKEQYAQLLVPILEIKQDLERVDELIHSDNLNGLEEASNILSKKQFVKLEFKKIFNAFADNIYYSDPDRANAYLGGGAIPKNEQSIAYLIRNDVLTNVENLQAEVLYLIKERKAGNSLETDDLFAYSKLCNDGMKKYTDLVSPEEMKLAKSLMK
jgi:hypothetical protein